MLNALWLNAQEINGTGELARLVQLEATVSAVATADPAAFVHIRALAATPTATATTLAAVDRQRTLLASALADAFGQGTAIADRQLRSEVAIFATAILGASQAREMAAEAFATVTGFLLPFDELLDGDGSIHVTVDPATLERIVALDVDAIITAITDTIADVVYTRGLEFDAHATATATAEPNVTDGFGVVNAYLSANAECVVACVEESFVSVRMASDVYAEASAVALFGAYRVVELNAGTLLAQAVATPAMLLATDTLGADGAVAVTCEATLAPVRWLAPVAATATASHAPLRVQRLSRMYANVAASLVADPAPITHFTGLFAEPVCRVTVVGDFRKAERLGADALAQALGVADAVVYTIHLVGGEAGATVTVKGMALERLAVMAAEDAAAVALAEADLRTNLFDDEPDYRTVFVSPQSFTATIAPQPFTIFITSDSNAMQTFEKQPGERLAYDIDLAEWFADLEGDDIESASALVVSATSGPTSALSIEQPLLIGDQPTRIKIWTEDGTNGVTYKVTATIITEGGRRKEVDFRLKIKEL